MNMKSANTDAEGATDAEADRLKVPAQFEAWASTFWDAAQMADFGLAQEAAMMGLAVLARLFPHPNAKAHLLLVSLSSLILAAKSGRTNHALMTKTGSIPGTKRGQRHSYVGGYAISAVNLLTDKAGYKSLAARKAVAQMLTDLGFSNRAGELGVAKPVTEYAIRNWIEKVDDYPLQHETAAAMTGLHSINLEHSTEVPEDQLLEYLREQARQAIAISQIL